MDTYVKFGATAFADSIEIDSSLNKEKTGRLTLQKSQRPSSDPSKQEVILNDLKMELWDQIPHIDRPGFQISQIADLIPRLLFAGHEVKMETSRSIKDEISSTSVYLSSAGEYAYIVGLLMYEDLSLYQEAYQNMNYLKERKREQIFKKRQRSKNSTVSNVTSKIRMMISLKSFGSAFWSWFLNIAANLEIKIA